MDRLLRSSGSVSSSPWLWRAGLSLMPSKSSRSVPFSQSSRSVVPSSAVSMPLVSASAGALSRSAPASSLLLRSLRWRSNSSEAAVSMGE